MQPYYAETNATYHRLMSDILSVMHVLCTSNEDVDRLRDISDDTLWRIAPTTHDIAVAIGNMSTYRTRQVLLRLVDEGLVVKTSVRKGLPLHWWIIRLGENQ